jgi:hypothetical protein
MSFPSELLRDLEETLALLERQRLSEAEWPQVQERLGEIEGAIGRSDAAAVDRALRSLESDFGSRRVATSISAANVSITEPVREYVNRLVHDISVDLGDGVARASKADGSRGSE